MDAVNGTVSAPVDEDAGVPMVGAVGGAVAVTLFEAALHTSPGVTPLLSITQHV